MTDDDDIRRLMTANEKALKHIELVDDSSPHDTPRWEGLANDIIGTLKRQQAIIEYLLAQDAQRTGDGR